MNPLDRRDFLVGGTAASVALASGARAQPAERARPNVLFVHTDQQSLETLSCLGVTQVRTPHMDRLAARGVSFLRSYSANPVCMPARSAWYTGRPSSENGVVMGLVPLRAELPDLGGWMRRAGYVSAYAGKWHVPGRDYAQSFDVLVGRSIYGELGDPVSARAAIGFLRAHDGQRPFFLNVGFLQPHDIEYWVRQLRNQVGPPDVAGLDLPPLPPNHTLVEDEPSPVRRILREGDAAQRYRDWDERQWRYYLWCYYRHVEMVDAELGRLLDVLDETGHAATTHVVFSSDHGEGMGRHRTASKGFLYEESVRVPLILAGPGLARGARVSDRVVSGLDLFPTICELAGVEPPADLRGLSLAPVAKGEAGTGGRDFIVSECAIVGRLVSTLRHKLVTYGEDEPDQLFDLEDDPWELRNRAADPACASVLRDLRERLRTFEASLDPAPMPDAGWRSLRDPELGGQ